MTRRLQVLLLAAFAASAALLFVYDGNVLAQGQPPPIPHFFKGTVQIGAGGQVPPDGHTLIARIDTRYESEPIQIIGGRFQGLSVGPEDPNTVGATITFFLDGLVQADQIGDLQARVPKGSGPG